MKMQTPIMPTLLQPSQFLLYYYTDIFLLFVQSSASSPTTTL